MKIIKIGIDVDGVIADLNREILRRLEARGVKNLPSYNELVSYNTRFCVSERIAAEIDREMEASDLVPSLPLIDPNAKGVIKNLILKKNSLVYFVTAPYYHNKHWMHQRLEWLVKHFGKNAYHTTIFAASVTKDLIDLDYLIEDHPRTILSARQAGIKPIVFDQPWNRNLPISIPRAFSWSQIEEYFINET